MPSGIRAAALLTFLLCLAGIAGCWRRAPDIHQVGGVVLTYQLDEQTAPDAREAVLRDLARALKRRLDLDGRRGVVVEPVGKGVKKGNTLLFA
jgi:hypothetical protein